MTLPTQVTPKTSDFGRVKTLIYGAPKIGKSTFCSQAPGAVFFATEAGLGHLDTFQVPITTWEEFLAACQDIAAGDHGFKALVIDTIDNAYRMCTEYICRRHKVDYVGDLEYGKGYALVNSEFHRVLTKLSHLPYGLLMVSHSYDKKLQSRTGELIKAIPTLPDRGRAVVMGMVDVILYCDVEHVVNGDKSYTRRVVRTKPAAHYEAGDRTGVLPEVLDLSWLEFEAALKKGQPRQPADPIAKVKTSLKARAERLEPRESAKGVVAGV